MLSSKSSYDSDFPESLEEFGLSKYEARAYLTMIGKGSLAVSEIAYYANLPRTKVYQTVKKLEKKRLAIVSKQKPLICSAIPPEEAFSELINLHERRVKNMKKIVDRLQKINDEGQRPKGSEERRYFILDPNSALEKIGSLIAHSRSSVVATLEPWGLRLTTQCKPSLVRALTNGSRVRVILGSQCLGSESLFSLPEGVELRLTGGDANLSNLLIIDSTHIVSIDSSNGKAALFTSADSFGALQSRNFEQEWEKSSELKRIEGTEPAVVTRAVELARIIENGLAAKMLEYAVSGNRLEMPGELIDVIDEKYGLRLGNMSSSEIMEIIDSALKISCLGGLRHDRTNNIVSLLSKVDSKQALPWALILASYFKRAGNEPRIMQQNSRGAQLVQLRLTKPVVP
ncbi:MAG: TrmB family transcriptional regulator [Nitrososphaera sp.]